MSLLSALLFIACAVCPALAAAAQASKPPNILILMAEDLSPRIGAYGDKIANTPNIDMLAKRSVRFTHAFTTAGVCAPSRAALITGQHQISFGGQHMRTSTAPLGFYLAQPSAEVRAFPEILRANGYFTFTDRKLDYQFSGIRAGSGPFTIWDRDGAGDTAWRERGQGQPFFGLINFIETHESGVMRQSGPAHSTSHAASQKMRAAITARRERITNPEEVRLPPYLPDLPEVRSDLARHYDNIHLMDRRVGKILQALKGDGLLENTIVVWTTDHGDGLPRSKRELYDSGTKVPLLIAYPPSLQDKYHTRLNQEDPRLVSFVDLAPTVLTWAGLSPPIWLHGMPLTTSDRSYVYASRDRIDEVLDRQRAIRSKQFRYIRSWYPDVAGGHLLTYRDNLEMVRAWRAAYMAATLTEQQAKWFEAVGSEQLYDLAADPHELNNLADAPDYQKTKALLRRELEQFLDRVGDTSTMPESNLRARLLENEQLRPTPAPEISHKNGFLTLSSPIGASIGYRTAGQTHWSLYHQPIPLKKQPIEAKSIRYGWLESPVVSHRP